MAVADRLPTRSKLLRLVEHPALKIAIPLLIGVIAFFVLHKLATHVKWIDVKTDLAATPWSALILALLCTAMSFVGISFYDTLAVRSIAPGKVPVHITALGGAAGYGVSGLLGFSYLTGTSIRYRIYSSFGLDLAVVAGVIAVSWTGFLSGMTLIFGGLLSAHPREQGTMLPISATVETGLGILLLVVLIAYFVWLATGSRSVKAGGFELPIPNLRTGVALTGAGILDLTASAMTLYVLLPGDVAQNMPYFFTIYFGAIALGVLSHSPGGLGVFEATIIAGLGASGRSDVLAALLIYRLIYTVLPFMIATAGLSVMVGIKRRSALTGSAQVLLRTFRPLIPPVASGIALLAGVFLLISGNLPAEQSNLHVLRGILPLSFIEASHLAGSIAGLLLIVVARGLYRKLHRAWVVAMALLMVGFFVSLFKGLDWQEALMMLATLVALGLFRPAFYRSDNTSIFRLNTAWVVSLIVLLVAILWIGLFAYSHVPYRNELWWDFTWYGDASRYLRASLAVAIILAVISFNSLVIGSKLKQKQPEEIPDVVRKLVAESTYAEAGIVLTGDKAFLIAEDESAFIAYADTGRTLIAKGDPVGDPKAGQKLIWQLRELADQQGKRCAFYAVSSSYLSTFIDLGLSILKIGEVARVNLQGFTLEGSTKKDLRQARNRAARDGYQFELIPAAALDTAITQELRVISDAWLLSKHGTEKGFSLGAFTEEYIANFDIAVLRSPTGEIVAFANLFKGANLHELSLDLMRYRPGGPSFAMDALFAEMMLYGAAQGYQWFSLGAAPFSGIENRKHASLWNRIGGLVYEHGEHFYNFGGLRAFKEKMGPEWSPNYLACPGGLAAPQILYEVNVLISGGIRGLAK